MGLDKPDAQRTAEEEALALIILCKPLERRFDPEHPNYSQLVDEQLEFFDLRVEFFRPRPRYLQLFKRRQTHEERLREIADRLLQLDEHLTQHSIGWLFTTPAPQRPESSTP